MKTLEEIQQEVGAEKYKEWVRQAGRDLEASPYRFREQAARQSFLWSRIQIRYGTYCLNERRQVLV